jgi:hypothetical protein
VSAVEHDVPRDRLKEMELELQSLSARYALTKDESLAERYRKLHARWAPLVKQTRLPV